LGVNLVAALFSGAQQRRYARGDGRLLLPKPQLSTINAAAEIVFAPKPEGGSMPTQRAILFVVVCTLVVICGFAAAPVAAADAAATAFVTKIYDAYKGEGSKGISIADEAAVRRYFEPSLAAAIVKDEKAAARRHDAPTLDSDPFIAAQDWDIPAIDIAVTDAPPDKAVATVSFKNIDQPTKIVLDLVKVKSDWRIANITWQRDGKAETLRGLYGH
jgi:hypothetical protein